MLWTIPITLAAAFTLASHSVGASVRVPETSDVSAPSIDDLLRKWGAAYGVEWRLLKAVAVTESRLNPNAVNAADNESIGLMQVLCRPDGLGGCSNKFNVDGWSEATRKKLFDPHFNIRIGAQIIAWNIRAYGLPKAIAVYNRWAERTALVAGPFENQSYVNAVLHNDTRIWLQVLPNRKPVDTFDLFGHLKQAHRNAAERGSTHRVLSSTNWPSRSLISPPNSPAWFPGTPSRRNASSSSRDG